MCLLARYVSSDCSFPLEPKCHGCLAAILADMSDSTLFYALYGILIGPVPFYWSCSPLYYKTQQNPTDLLRQHEPKDEIISRETANQKNIWKIRISSHVNILLN